MRLVASSGIVWHMSKPTSPQTDAVAAVEPVFLTVQQAALKLSLSTFSIYKMLDDGRLDGVYQGARRYVVAESVPKYVASLSSTPPAESA